jgi:hypothetical protein
MNVETGSPETLQRKCDVLIIGGKTPIWSSLRAFKAVYYIVSFANLKRSIAALRRRRINIQPGEPDRMAAG